MAAGADEAPHPPLLPLNYPHFALISHRLISAVLQVAIVCVPVRIPQSCMSMFPLVLDYMYGGDFPKELKVC